MRGVHDIGGLPDGPVPRDQHAVTLSEKRIDALMTLLSDNKRRLLRVDEMRRAIESLGAEAYDTLGYYERWLAAITAIMVEKGVLTNAEIEARVAVVKARLEAEA